MSAPIDGEGLEQRPQFPVLDTLRAVGALAVLTTHVTYASGDYVRHGIVGGLFSRLDVGVAIFFVLSGFLLSRPYLARSAAGLPMARTRPYYRHRFFRIYPLYAVCVVLALVVLPVNHGGGWVWLRTLSVTNVFLDHPLPAGLTQMWSLSVEATFYLVLPLLMVLALGRGCARYRPRRVLAVLVAGTLLACWWNAGLASAVDGVTTGAPLLWLPAHLTWFLAGTAIALLHVQHQHRPDARGVAPLVALGRMPGVCWTSAAGLLLVAATPVGGPILLLVATPGQTLAKHLLYAVIAGLVVLSGVFAAPGRSTRVLSAPALRHLGRISYSVFCIHLVVLELVRLAIGHVVFSGRGPELWVLTVVGSIAAAEVLYRVVEVPSLRLKYRRGTRPAPDEATNSPESASTTAY